MKSRGNRRNGGSDNPEGKADQREGRGKDWSLLTRTSVYRRVPAAMRRRLDRTLLMRPEGCTSLDAILHKFRLNEQFGITREALGTYARKIERLAEPYLAGLLAAAVVGCMPTSYRDQVTAGSQIILVSQAVQALTNEDKTLKAPDLLKLASTLRAAAQRNISTCKCGSYGQEGSRMPPGDRKRGMKTDQEALADTLRTVYGLDWPPTGQAKAVASDDRQAVMEK